jgi:hypothetical protein
MTVFKMIEQGRSAVAVPMLIRHNAHGPLALAIEKLLSLQAQRLAFANEAMMWLPAKHLAVSIKRPGNAKNSGTETLAGTEKVQRDRNKTT